MPLITAIQPGVPAHHLDDHDAVVRLGRRVQPVDRLGRDRHRRVEAERVVGSREIVVDRLRHADDREVVLAEEPGGDAERVLAADRDQRVEPAIAEVLEHLLDAAVELVRIRAARADDRAAARQDPRDLAAGRGRGNGRRRARASPRARRRSPSPPRRTRARPRG